MAQLYGFFNSKLNPDGTYDRAKFAEDFAMYFASFIGNGVFPNPSTGLQVVPGQGMSVNVLEGKAWIDGYWYYNTEALNLQHKPASGTLKRIDAVVVRWSSSNRDIETVIKEGVPALSPTRPLPQWDADRRELVITYTTISQNAIQINQANLEDTRYNKNLCGIVHGIIDQLDTTTLGQQLQGFIDSYIAKTELDYDNWILFLENLKMLCNSNYQNFISFLQELKVMSQGDYDDFVAYLLNLKNNADTNYIAFIDWLNQYKISAQGEFETWFETIKDILDENVAGHLQLEIEELQKLQPTAEIGIIPHNLKNYPHMTMYATDWAMGVGGLDNAPLDNTTLVKVNGGFEHLDRNITKISCPEPFKTCTEMHKVSDTEYAFVDVQSAIETVSLLVVLN